MKQFEWVSSESTLTPRTIIDTYRCNKTNEIYQIFSNYSRNTLSVGLHHTQEMVINIPMGLLVEFFSNKYGGLFHEVLGKPDGCNEQCTINT